MYVQDTIAAISTAPGEGGIGIIRVSGPGAEAIAQRIIISVKDGGLQSHRFYYGTAFDPADGSHVDEVLYVLMRAPRSYTREDVLEIHGHGGFTVIQRLLAIVLQQGVRLADPGEFTRRAFLNGRIDLLQAEAVIDVIRSKTDFSLSIAQRQREGELSRHLATLRVMLVESLALLEAHLDFPEEEIDAPSARVISTKIEEVAASLRQLLEGFRSGKIIREGASVVIAGKPNVGKSSLMNALLREKRAIVTSIPGTTRDVIEEIISFNGIPVKLADTAGIRETEDVVEQAGVELVRERIPSADLVLFVVDGSRPFENEDAAVLRTVQDQPFVLVINKGDLPQQIRVPAVDPLDTVLLSTKTDAGLDDLRKIIYDSLSSGQVGDSSASIALNQQRHRDSIFRCRAALKRFLQGFTAGLDTELLAADLRDALHALGEVTGETTPDEILDIIFSRFCIGK